jgi:hypothetical protein
MMHPPLQQGDADEVQRAWNYHQAADVMLHQRVTFGLALYAMLLTGYAAIFLSKFGTSWLARSVEIGLCFIGILFSVLFHRRIIGLEKRMDFLKATYLRPIDPIYNNYMSQSEDKSWRHSTLPAIFSVLWICLLAVAGIWGNLN